MVPYRNPYTPGKAQTGLFSTSQSPQHKLEHALRVLVRSSNAPSRQNVEHLSGLVEQANSHIAAPGYNQGMQCCWSPSMAESLAKFVVRVLGKPDTIVMTGRNSEEGYPSILYFLARSLDQWSHYNSIMDAVVVREFEIEHEHRFSLSEVLHNLAVLCIHPSIKNPAMMGLSVISRYLGRIQFLVSWKNPNEVTNFSSGSAWWIRDEHALAKTVIAALLSEQDQADDHFQANQEEQLIAWISLLTDLLKHNGASWFHLVASQHKKSLQNLSQKLLGIMRGLSDPDLTSRQSLHCAIASVSLLLLLDHNNALKSDEFQHIFSSTKMLDSVFRSAFGIFGANSPRGPRWTFEHQDTCLLQRMEELILIWSLCNDGETRNLAVENLDRHWRPHIEECWRSLLTEDYSNPADTTRKLKHVREQLSRLVLMYTVHHDSLRGSLFGIMTQLSSGCETGSAHFLISPCRTLLKALQHLCFNPDPSVALCAASLMRSLLSERGRTTMHDDIFLRAMDSEIIQRLIHGVVELAKSFARSPKSFCPILLSLLDILDVAFSWEPSLRAIRVADLFDAECIDVLIHLMTPMYIQIDNTCAVANDSQNTTMMEDLDNDTQIADNLSRLDERSIVIEEEKDQKVLATGVDHAIRLAGATVLARLGYAIIFNDLEQIDHQNLESGTSCENEIGARLLQSKIRAAVTDFFIASSAYQHEDRTSYNSDSSSTVVDFITNPSMELVRRHFRLLASMAVPENEEFLASYLYVKNKGHENAVAVLQKNVGLCREKLAEAARKEAALVREIEECQNKIDAQSFRFWQEVQRTEKSVAEATRSKVAQFDAERRVAERRVLATSNLLKAAEIRAHHADALAKASKEAEARLKFELNDATRKAVALEAANRELKGQLAQKDLETVDLEEKLEILVENENKLNRMLASKDTRLTDLQGAQLNMESNLDNMFADLVKLSHMYQVQETKAKELHAQIYDSRRAMADEHQQSAYEKDRLRRENEQLQGEKDRLEKKLQRYKEKMEKMRNEGRAREQKQRSQAPISYVKSLHNSMKASSAQNTKENGSDTIQKISSSSKTHSFRSNGKENSYQYASKPKYYSKTSDKHSSTSEFRSRSNYERE